MTQKASLLCLLVLALSAAPAANAQPTEESSGMIVERDVWVTTRAGFRVLVNVYRPDKPGRYPTLISMGPYGKDDLPAEYNGIFGDGQIQVSEYTAFETPDPEYWVHFDYVVIAADSPGSHRSEGDLEIFGPIEANAFYDVIEWAGTQSWSNGNVGLNGVSYFAMSQWYVAALNPPHLKAIMPAEGLTDPYRDLVRHGGIPSEFPARWMRFRVLPALNPKAQLVRDIGAGATNYPFDSEFWQAWVPELENITVPAYVSASWSDHGLHTRGTLIGFEEISSEQKWLEVHGRKKWEFYYSRDSLERQRRFFDHFLKGADNGMDLVPRVRYERRNAFYNGEIVHANNWPLTDADNQRFYLHPDGGLAQDAAVDAQELQFDASAESQLTFRHVFEQDTEMTGGAKLRLWVEAEQADDLDLFVGLSKLDRNGNEVFMAGYDDVENGHLASGWLRVSHRELDADRSTETRPFLKHERELKLVSGEKVSVEVEIHPSSTFFAAGESLALRIQSSELTGAGDIIHEDPVNFGEYAVHVGGSNDSYLLLPVILGGVGR